MRCFHFEITFSFLRNNKIFKWNPIWNSWFYKMFSRNRSENITFYNTHYINNTHYTQHNRVLFNVLLFKIDFYLALVIANGFLCYIRFISFYTQDFSNKKQRNFFLLPHSITQNLKYRAPYRVETKQKCSQVPKTTSKWIKIFQINFELQEKRCKCICVGEVLIIVCIQGLCYMMWLHSLWITLMPCGILSCCKVYPKD